MRFTAAATLVVAFSLIGCGSEEAAGDSSAATGEPQERLAKHLEKLAELLGEHEDEPSEAISALREYGQEHLPDITQASLELVVELDRIEDPGERGERALEHLAVIQEPSSEVAEKLFALRGAVKEDEGAQALLEKMGRRWVGVVEDLEETTKPLESRLRKALEGPVPEPDDVCKHVFGLFELPEDARDKVMESCGQDLREKQSSDRGEYIRMARCAMQATSKRELERCE